MTRSLLTTKKDVDEWFANHHHNIVSFDTETTSLKYKELDIEGVSFFNGDDACYIMFMKRNNEGKITWINPNKQEILQKLKEVFSNDIMLLIAHNIVFDLKVIHKFGIPTNKYRTHCTMVADHLIDENRRHGLKFLAENILSHDVINYQEAISEGTGSDKFIKYATDDAVWCWELFVNQRKFFDKHPKIKTLFSQTEMPFQHIIVEMETTGFLIDKEKLHQTRDKLFLLKQELIKNLHEEVGLEYQIQNKLGDEPSEIVSNFNLNSTAVISDIMFNKLNLPVIDKTPTGAASVGKNTINKLKNQSEFVLLLHMYRTCQKLLTSFFIPYEDHIDSDGRVRPNFMDTGTKTGRLSCIAKGTKIQTVRDFSISPEGISIEEVKKGDYVYCTDKNNNLKTRKVIDVINNGKRECIKLKWYSLSNLFDGSLVLTPEHKVKLIDGSWVRADMLKPITKSEVGRLRRESSEIPIESRLNALHFQISDYVYIYSRHLNKVKNGRFLQNINSNKKCCHHLDGNKLNDSYNNLVTLSLSNHSKLHQEEFLTEEARKKGNIKSALNRKLGITKTATGYNNKNTLRFSKQYCINLIKEAKGNKNLMLKIHDFYTLKREFEFNNILWNDLYLYAISREDFVSKLIELDNVDKASRYFNIGFRRGKTFINFHKIKPTEWKSKYRNHILIGVEPAGVHEVYDIVVESFDDEDTHNFFANEICVHNCSNPNLQQLSKTSCRRCGSFKISNEVCKDCGETKNFSLRSCFVVPSGYKMITCDYSGQEVRVMAEQSKDPTLIDALCKGQDMHLKVANQFFELGIPDECLFETHPEYNNYRNKYKKERTKAKTITFGLSYGKTSFGFAKDFDINEEEAQELVDKYFEGMKQLKQAIDNAKKNVIDYGFVESMAGRRRHFDKIYLDNGDSYYPKKVYRQAFNFLIQSFSADMIRKAMIMIRREFDNKPEMEFRFLATVHDEIVAQVKEEYIEEASTIVKDCMERAVIFVVPTPADVGIGDSYEEAK